MTTVQKTVQTASKQERKAIFMLLISKIPKGYGYAEKVAQQLKKYKTTKGKPYTARIVYDTMHQGNNDYRIEKALVTLNEKYFDMPIEAIYPEYTPPFYVQKSTVAEPA